MNHTSFSSLAALGFLLLAAVSPGQPNAQPAPQGKSRGDRIPGQYIVVLKDGVTPDAVSRRHGLVPEHVYSHALNGFAGAFTSRQLWALLADPLVDWLEEDQVVTIGAQSIQPGILRVAADKNAKAKIDGNDERVNVDIAIIDTGISLKHPDLNVVKSVSYVTGTRNGNDDNGHGTHCAGIAAAVDNGTGVVGVAPGARLWAVKVLSKSGSGTMSGVIKGVDYVTSNASSIEVANLSLGGGDSAALKDAIAKSVAKGVVFVVAAGNSGVDAVATSPANSPVVLCVSATVDTDGMPGGLGKGSTYGLDDTLASFSNYGSVVDIAAPGVDIISTYPGGYASMSGTSMAAPHVAGAAALYLAGTSKPTNALGVEAVRNAIISAGFVQAGPGGFTGDRDLSPEPLLNAGSL